MDWPVIEEKLESLRRCLRRVEVKCPADVNALVEDIDAQDILALNLTRAVQICVDIGAHLIKEGGFALGAADYGCCSERGIVRCLTFTPRAAKP